MLKPAQTLHSNHGVTDQMPAMPAWRAYLLAGLVSFVLSAGAVYLSWQPGSIAMLWYANSAGVIALLFRPSREWPAMFVTLLACGGFAHFLLAPSFFNALLFLPGNGLEILLGAWLLRRSGAHLEAVDQPGRLLGALLYGAVIPVSASASLNAAIAALYGSTSFGVAWPKAFEGNLIGAISVLPLGFFILNRGWRGVSLSLRGNQAVLALLLTVSVALVVPLKVPFPFIYVALPQVLTAIRFGFGLTATATLAMSISLNSLIAAGILVAPAPDFLWGHVLLYVPLLICLLPGILLAASVEQNNRRLRELVAGKERYQSLYLNTPAMMQSCDMDGRIISVSRLWLEKLGYAADEVIGRSYGEFLAEESARRSREVELPQLLRNRHSRDIEYRMITKRGSKLDVLLSAIVDNDEFGRPTRILSVIEDVTEKKRLAAELQAEQELFEVTLHSIGDGVISSDAKGKVLYLNPVAETMIGWTRSEAVGRQFSEVVALFDQDTMQALGDPVQRCISEVKKYGLPDNTILRGRSGKEYAVQDSVSPIRNREGELLGAVMVFQDVSETRALARRMSYLAHHDVLTDLPNRVLLQDRIERACQAGLRNGRAFCVVFMDLDHFKHVNDSMGHAFGDDLLRMVAERLKGTLRGSDTVSRFGGDEFVLLLDDVDSQADISNVAEKILAAVARPCMLGETEVNISISLGIAVFPNDGYNAEVLMKHADAAMYRAKREGRNRYHFFSQAIDVAASERLSIESDIRKGMTQQQFCAYYQPLVDCATGSIVGVEALARWKRNSHGLQAPSVFIPVAEESGLIVPLGQLILEQACRQFKHWLDLGHDLHTLAVNISPIQFNTADFTRLVAAALHDSGLDGRYLELEITESTLMRSPEAACTILNVLRAMGVRVAIDDFGTGYSSLSYLRRFPVDTLKIDRSFVGNIADKPDDLKIVEAIVSLGRSLELHVVAEGVEEEFQADMLKRMGCDTMQGFLFAQPGDTEATEAVFMRCG